MDLQDNAPLSPGLCIVSRAPSGPFFDTGIELDMWGRVYLHESIGSEAANLLGFVDPAPLEAKIADLRAERDALKAANGELTVTNASLEQILATKIDGDVSIATATCRYCGATKSSHGNPFLGNKRALVQHERFCTSNPDRAAGVLENAQAKESAEAANA